MSTSPRNIILKCRKVSRCTCMVNQKVINQEVLLYSSLFFSHLNIPLIDAKTSTLGLPNTDRGMSSNPTILPVACERERVTFSAKIILVYELF